MADEDLIHPASLSLVGIDDEGARALFRRGRLLHTLSQVSGSSPGGSRRIPTFTNYTATHLPFPGGEPESYFGAAVGGHWFAINADI